MSDDGLNAALARAQAKFPTIQKAHTNTHFGSKYADLADVLAAVRPVLAEEGITLTQPLQIRDEGTVLVTRLRRGTETEESEMVLPIDGVGPQQVGSLMTYYRRFQACAMLGVAAEDDDDGNSAQESVTHGSRSERSSGRSGGSGAKLASEAQRNFAQRLLDETIHHSLHAQTISERIGRPATIDELMSYEATPLIDWLKEQKKAGRTPDGDVPDGEPFDVGEAGGPSPADEDRALSEPPGEVGEASPTSAHGGPTPPRRRAS